MIDSRMEFLPYEELLEAQIEELRKLIEGPWREAPALAQSLKEAGLTAADLANPVDILRFPTLHKSELPVLQAAAPPFGGLLAVPPSRLRRIFSSPGPIFDPEGDLPSYWRWERALSAAGFREGDVVLNCLSYHLTPAGSMFDEAARNLGCVVIPAGIGNSEIQIETARQAGANAYVGLPSYLGSLMEKAREAGKRLPLAKAFVLAEKLPESLRQSLQGQGVSVFQGYGTADTGAIAFECERKQGLHLDPSALVELLDPGTGHPQETGLPGEVVVTPLNPVYALLRFGTGDLSILEPSPCTCGRRTPRLMGLLGRVDNATKVRGLFLHPEQLAEILSRFPAVTAFRAVVTRERAMDDLTLEVEAAAALGEEVLERIAARAKELLKLSAAVAQVPAGTIPPRSPVVDDRRKWD